MTRAGNVFVGDLQGTADYAKNMQTSAGQLTITGTPAVGKSLVCTGANTAEWRYVSKKVTATDTTTVVSGNGTFNLDIPLGNSYYTSAIIGITSTTDEKNSTVIHTTNTTLEAVAAGNADIRTHNFGFGFPLVEKSGAGKGYGLDIGIQDAYITGSSLRIVFANTNGSPRTLGARVVATAYIG